MSQPGDPSSRTDGQDTRAFSGDPVRLVESLLQTRDVVSPHKPGGTSTERTEHTLTPEEVPLPAKYRYLGKLGRGGMGEVYHAFDTDLQRHVAIKFLLPQAASVYARRRFLEEARILAQLQHPNVVGVYEKGEFDGQPYFVMAYLNGFSLAERREEFRTSAAQVVGVMTTIAEAVQYTHTNGVFHRDLKASNVVFDGRQPVVTDFGCARWEDGEISTQGFALLGTPSHMAPEVFEHGSKEHDARADLWSLGVMLYHLLSGRLPFADDPRTEAGRAKLMSEDPAPIRSCPKAVPGVDARLEAIVAKTLAKNPADRYQTAAELAGELSEWHSLLPQTPRREAASPTTQPLVRSPAHRRRQAWWAVAGVTVVVALAVSFAFWQRGNRVRPTIAGLVNQGNSVVVIDEAGIPRWPLTKVDGFEGGIETSEPERALLLTTGSVLLARLPTDGLTHPYRVRGQVHHSVENLDSEVGLVVAHRVHSPTEHTIYTNTFRAEGPASGRTRVRRALGFGGPRWVSLAQLASPLNDFGAPPTELSIPPHPTRSAGEAAEYRDLSVVVTADGVIAEHAGRPFPTRRWAEVTRYALAKFEAEERPAPAPLFGDGVGLLVRNGSGLFRNVVIEPFTTP